MNPINYINPVRQPNISLFSNIGVGANTKVYHKNTKKPVNKIIDKRLDNLAYERVNLENLLKQKEKDQIYTLKRIEEERQRREKEELDKIKGDIQRLKQQLDAKNTLYQDIHNMYKNQKETNYQIAISSIEESKKLLNDGLVKNESELIKLRKDELQYHLQLKEKEIISKYEKEKQELEAKRREEERVKLIEEKKTETEKQINAIKLKYLEREQKEIRDDILFKQKEEKLLRNDKVDTKTRTPLNIQANPNHYEDDDENIPEAFLQKTFGESYKTSKAENRNPLQAVLSKIDKSQDNENEESQVKMGLMKKLLTELYPTSNSLPPNINDINDVTEMNQSTRTKENVDSPHQDGNKTNNKRELIQTLPNLVGGLGIKGDSLRELLEEDEHQDYSQLISKINSVDNAFNN